MNTSGSHAGDDDGEPHVSAFGGHILAEVAGMPDSAVDKLAALDITDAEQIVALAALPMPREHLYDLLGGRAAETDDMVARARATLPANQAETLETPGAY